MMIMMMRKSIIPNFNNTKIENKNIINKVMIIHQIIFKTALNLLVMCLWNLK